MVVDQHFDGFDTDDMDAVEIDQLFILIGCCSLSPARHKILRIPQGLECSLIST